MGGFWELIPGATFAEGVVTGDVRKIAEGSIDFVPGGNAVRVGVKAAKAIKTAKKGKNLINTAMKTQKIVKRSTHVRRVVPKTIKRDTIRRSAAKSAARKGTTNTTTRAVKKIQKRVRKKLVRKIKKRIKKDARKAIKEAMRRCPKNHLMRMMTGKPTTYRGNPRCDVYVLFSLTTHSLSFATVTLRSF